MEEDLKGKAVGKPYLMCLYTLMHSQKDKEDLEELSQELELADEDEKVPYGGSILFLRSS